MYEYPFGNGQQLNLDWFLAEWKNLLAAWEAEKNGIEGALQAEIDRAEAALADVFAARDAAAQSAANALESKNAAAQSASDASGYLATVRADANTASNAAQNAAQSESNAAESAQTALASKNTAANSERNAAQSEQNALASKNAAAQSAEDALAHKDAAAQSAADALANKNAAAQSAEDAEDAAASVEASAQQITINANDINNLKESNSDFLNQIPTKESAGYANTIYDGADNIPIKEVSFAGGITYFALGTRETPTKNLNNTTLNSLGKETANNLQRVVEYLTENIDSITIAVYKSSSGYREIQIFGYNKDETEATLIARFNNEHGFIRTYDTTTYHHIKIDISNASSVYFATIYTNLAVSPELVKTFKGENTFMSVNRNISLIYRCDIETYIDEKIAEVQATLLENIGG